MAFIGTLLLSLGVATASWLVAVTLLAFLPGGPDLRREPGFLGKSAEAVGLASLALALPYPVGYALSLLVWWLEARQTFGLARPRALALWLVLASLSLVGRLAGAAVTGR